MPLLFYLWLEVDESCRFDDFSVALSGWFFGKEDLCVVDAIRVSEQ